MFDTLYTQIGAIIVISVLAFAMIKGEEPERIFAGFYLVAWLATLLIQSESDLSGWQPTVFGIDAVVLAVLIALSWKTNRVWPVWAAGFQLLVLMGVALPWLDARAPVYSHIVVINIGTFAVLICLAVGAFWAWQERRAAGLE